MKWLPIVCIALLSACGSDDSSAPVSPSQPSETPDSTPLSLSLYGKLSVNENDTVSLAVMPDSGQTIKSVRWHFNSSLIELLAPTSQAIGFDAPAPGEYAFSVTATDTAGRSHTVNQKLTVEASQNSFVQIRLSHQAVELGRVSLKATIESDESIDNIRWEVTRGPDTQLIQSEFTDTPGDTVYFQAPSVANDTLLEIQATVENESGLTQHDSAFIVVKDTPEATQGFFAGNDIYPTDLMHAYKPGPYQEAILQCLYNSQISQSCKFATLPLIGQDHPAPSVDTILQRTLVSHDWMGDAFKQFLLTSPARADILQLLRATTGVVIAYDIRPSFYWSATGAIYLDANKLWRSAAQRDTLDRAPDYRTRFGDELQYRSSWRYVQSNELYFPQPGLPESDRRSRTQQQVNAALSWLLYHELAHANDFFPPTSWAELTLSDSPLSYANRHLPVSATLEQIYTLTSESLVNLAQVTYGGAEATLEQKQFSALDVAYMFAEDSAVSMYSYFTPQEDFATLFERFMMLHRLQVDADIALFDNDAIKDGNFPVSWAQRNRINAAHIQARAAFVVQQVLPELATASAQNAMPQPILFSAGDDWFTTLSPGVQTIEQNAVPKHKNTLRVTHPDHFERTMRLPVTH
ncbi:hypothetical protein [Alteromonas lipotrueiana]|uniref:hypothetical protein n=1 Tax=Alteromonas lipotrueiana TaxID=2803815 RepID=UPI001C44DCF7|nr:hypothetical protein [Alteromonas lipotrueiana]